MEPLKYVCLYEAARPPKKSFQTAAGFDLHSAENVSIQSKDRLCIKTGLQISIPPGCYGRIAPRSGLAVKHGLHVGAGVIDRDFRGEIEILLFNFGDSTIHIKIGERIAQLILEKIYETDAVKVEQLDATTRGNAGFGSTGN